eukprot:CAMPEP_0195030932 /NCGR_PEP_ID=MMETSP0326_2-20130528/60045_1 /TAXON_ID=2866 ORGANISM="Crypthecodinium cohnii, Strain Seligo" /NCGR_SAMPLE_ID=MMETSP0326_2 /ASSEMBLY_ACC=CAM_ASM_000348 /LENGTH=202 /DNA_ID=CAMNT_0040054407 /DNA_START=123 /DNA_END=729 /DNA_ORIENTATION=-
MTRLLQPNHFRLHGSLALSTSQLFYSCPNHGNGSMLLATWARPFSSGNKESKFAQRLKNWRAVDEDKPRLMLQAPEKPSKPPKQPQQDGTCPNQEGLLPLSHQHKDEAPMERQQQQHHQELQAQAQQTLRKEEEQQQSPPLLKQQQQQQLQNLLPVDGDAHAVAPPPPSPAAAAVAAYLTPRRPAGAAVRTALRTVPAPGAR